MNNKKTQQWYIGGALIVVVIVIFIIALSRSPETDQSDIDSEGMFVQVPSPQGVKRVDLSKQEAPDIEQIPTPQPVDASRPSTTPMAEETPMMNPEDQPRKFYVLEFDKLQEFPEGYSVENLRLTERGIELDPQQPGEEDKPRYGVLESPPQEFDFPSNAISPLWKEDLPEGTSMLVEMSLSPDGKNWGIWHQVMVDDDSVGQIAEYYPDGSPNPNYGYTPGGVLCWGLRQWAHFRYRITLYSEVAASPILSGFRLFYQDSTLGEGYLSKIEGQDE